MTLLALIIAAATATFGDPTLPEGSGWISGNTLVTLLSGISGLVGAIITKITCDRSAAKKLARQEEELRTSISNELRTKILNDPLHIEQTSYQASMKLNAEQHADLFNRMRVIEADVAGIKATITAKFDGLSAQLMETREMVRSLYDKVCNGGKRK